MIKIFIVVLSLGACHGKFVRTKCSPSATLEFVPHCGILPNCYQNAPNKWVLIDISCTRKGKGLPDFLETRRGKCPTDKPPCPPNN